MEFVDRNEMCYLTSCSKLIHEEHFLRKLTNSELNFKWSRICIGPTGTRFRSIW